MKTRPILFVGIVLVLLLGLTRFAWSFVSYGSGTSGEIFTFDPGDATGAVLASPGGTNRVAGLAFDTGGRLYATIQPAGSGNPNDTAEGRLLELEPTTGELLADRGVITVGGMNIRIADISFQPGTNILYGSRAGTGEIYTINTATAEATLLGASCAQKIGGLAFSGDGVLYATVITALNDNALLRLDPSTGACIESTQLDLFYDGLGVDPRDGTLYACKSDSSQIFRFSVPVTTEELVGSAAGNCTDLTFAGERTNLRNISGRAAVGTGDDVVIAGMIIRERIETETRIPDVPPVKSVVFRGIGPSLNAAGLPLPGLLLDPVLEIYDGDGALIAMNDNWRDSQETELEETGLAPAANEEAAILVTLAAEMNYTAILRGKNDTVGIGLVEAYDIDLFEKDSNLVNISVRALVGGDDDVLIGGFIVRGDIPTSILLRALGGSLTTAGVANALPDPLLELYDANGNSVASNDDWVDSPDAGDIIGTGLAPLDSRESAILFRTAFDTYTALVRGKSETGVALVEVYEIGPSDSRD